MRPPAQGQWNPEQHHRWSPRQEGGDSGPEEKGPWSPGLGILQPASACSLSQERGGSGFDAIGSVRCPRPCRTENCAQRRAATVAAGARTSPGLCYSDTNLFCYCVEQDNRSLACLFFKSFYYRDIQINWLNKLVKPPGSCVSLLRPPVPPDAPYVAPRPPSLFRSSELGSSRHFCSAAGATTQVLLHHSN